MNAAALPEGMPPEGRLLAQALSDGFRSLQATVTPAGDSEPVVTPRHTRDGHIHTEGCMPLVGEDYPATWCTCQEERWQALCDDVDTDQWVQAQRSRPVLSQCVGVCVSAVSVPVPSGLGTTDTPTH